MQTRSHLLEQNGRAEFQSHRGGNCDERGKRDDETRGSRRDIDESLQGIGTQWWPRGVV